MGALFLYRKSADIDIDNVKQEFYNKGFQNPKEFSLGEWKIIVYAKMATGQINYRFIDGDAVFSVGAPIYKEMNCSDSLAKLLADFQCGILETTRLLGHFNLVYFIKGKVFILCDPLNVKHLFTDSQHQFYTSSFLAAAAACRGELTLNKMAVYEKLLSGIIIAPDTVLKEIKQLDIALMDVINGENAGIYFILNYIIFDRVEYHSSGLRQSVESQGEVLKDYFRKISAAAKEYGADIGFSGGYDSRLVFAVADLCFHDNLHAHTHSTGHVHEIEKSVALEMAGQKGIPCTVIPTQRLDEIEADIEPLLLDNLYFFDGRTSFDIGGLSATYTAKYRAAATEGRGFTMTGVGGEAYRNNYSISGNKVDMQKFLCGSVFNRFFDEAVHDITLREQVVAFHLKKAEKRLNLNLRGKVDRLAVRRYYSELMMPEGQGVVIDAYNQVSSCIAPFIEPAIIKEAYKGLKYFGSGGRYQEAIIRYLDPALAHIRSSYGYPFDRIPLKYKMKEWVRTHIPTSLWDALAQLKGRNTEDNGRAYLYRISNKSKMMENALAYLKNILPDVNCDKLLSGNSAVPNVGYLAMALYQWKDRLRADE